jgi:hypothetical protein
VTRIANFFLVGAPKAGTTSLQSVLAAHPEVFLSPIKEPCHFCTDVQMQLGAVFDRQSRFDLTAYLDAPVRAPVHLHMVRSPADYARLFDGAGNARIVGECSTFYLSSSDAARNIHDYNPEARIAVLLRDPLQRIRSHYVMDRSLGNMLRPLPALIDEERALGPAAHWGNCRYYLGASRYHVQLQEYWRWFPHDQVCVLSFERLLADPAHELGRLFAFLDLVPPPGELTLPTENRARAARFPRVNRWLRASGLRPFVAHALRRTLPPRLCEAAASTFYRAVDPLPPEAIAHVAEALRDEGIIAGWHAALASAAS